MFNTAVDIEAIATAAAIAAATAAKEATKGLIEDLRGGRDGDKDKDKVGLPSWEVDPQHADAIVEPWPGASYTVPADMIELVKRGMRPPLIWLTVEALVGAEDGETRKPLKFPLNNKQQERVNEAYRKDSFLPRGPTHQALQVLASICRAVGPPTNDNDKNHAVLLVDMHLGLMTRITDTHWPVWRRYIKQALDAMWAKREPGVGMSFDIGKINETLVRKAERQCGKPPGHVDDFTDAGKTWVSALLRAEGDEIGRIGATMEDLHQQGLYNTPKTDNAAPVHAANQSTAPRRQVQGPPVADGPSQLATLEKEAQASPRDLATIVSPCPSVPRASRWQTTSGDSVASRTLKSLKTSGGWVGGGEESRSPSAIDSIVERSACRSGTGAASVTTAPGAELTVTRLSLAPAASEYQSVIQARCSPLIPGAFEEALRIIPSSHQDRLRHDEQVDIVRQWKDKALEEGWAHGPFIRADIEATVGPFVSIPLTIVHTPATTTKPEKNRVCFNATWSPHTSVGPGFSGIPDSINN
ncbi:unnamed protein product [Tilletia caries]|nr:unnamed protein product [Tilletia caries]